MKYIILIGFTLLPLFVSLFFSVFFMRRQKRGRRSPLTAKLFRGPGESLREELEKNMEQIENAYFRMLFVSLPPAALILLSGYLRDSLVPYWQVGIALILYAALIYWGTRRLYLVLKQRRNLYLGLDAELAVGQELNQLMAHGCRVYHDFPAENFNIDHVVVGPGGVYAIETKGRAKPDKGRGTEDAKVLFEGQRLVFPDWAETKPLEQAKRQAAWLSKWLSSAVGSSVVATPALALPGWFVKQTKRGEVLVFSGKNPIFLSRSNSQSTLTEQQIQQIAHQLEQRCRNVEPVAYSDKKK